MMVWLSVRVHMMNQNAYPAVSEDVLAALPTRGQPTIKMNGNHTTLFKSGTPLGLRSARCHQP
jgi:hypothetical protein